MRSDAADLQFTPADFWQRPVAHTKIPIFSTQRRPSRRAGGVLNRSSWAASPTDHKLRRANWRAVDVRYRMSLYESLIPSLGTFTGSRHILYFPV